MKNQGPEMKINVLKYGMLSGLILALAGCAAKKKESDTGVDQLLLKNYRPKSIYQIPEHEVERARYPVIDMHSHSYPENSEQVKEWVKTLQQRNIEKVVVMTYQTGATFDSLYNVYSKYGDQFAVFCGLDFTGYQEDGFPESAIKELERLHDEGARGIGELGDKGRGLFYSKPTEAIGMHIDDPRMDPILDKAGELGMPVNIHVADPMWMYEKMDSTNDGLMNAVNWRLDNKKNILDHDELLKTLENAVKKHPNTTFIAAHLANNANDLSKIGVLFDKYPNLYGDIGARYAELSQIPRHVAAFMEKYQDRIVYGTDMGTSSHMYKVTFRILETMDEHFYEHSLFGYHWSLNGFNLSDPVLKKIYHTNASKILNDENS